MNSKKSKTDLMMEYISQKYPGDRFSYIEPFGGYLGSNKKTIIVGSKKYPERKIQVSCIEEEGRETYLDTYLGVRFETETREYLQQLFEESYGSEVYVLYEANDGACTENGSDQTTLEEYMSTWTSHIRFAVIVGERGEENSEKTEDFIRTAFEGLAVQGTMYFYTDVPWDSDSTDDEILELIKERGYYASAGFWKEYPDELTEFEWRDQK